MIKYTEVSIPVTSDGYYLVRLEEDRSPAELVIAEALVGSDGDITWQPTGADYDAWTHGSQELRATVICGFDLVGIAEGAKRLFSPAQEALDWYAMEGEALAKAVLERNHAVIAACITVLTLDGGKKARQAL